MRRFFVFATIAAVGLFVVAQPVEAAITTSVNGINKNINLARASYRIPSLRRSWRLDRAAQIRANALILQARLDHGYRATSASTIIRQVGYRATRTGELLAADYMSSLATVTAWKNSPLHRSIMLSRGFRDVGIAVVHTPPGSPFRVISVVIVAAGSGL